MSLIMILLPLIIRTGLVLAWLVAQEKQYIVVGVWNVLNGRIRNYEERIWPTDWVG